MEVIVLQHINIEDPGFIKDLMVAESVKLTTIELDEGEKIPKISELEVPDEEALNSQLLC